MINWKGSGRKRSWNFLRYDLNIFLEVPKKFTKNPSQDNWSSGLDSKAGIFEYKEGVPPLDGIMWCALKFNKNYYNLNWIDSRRGLGIFLFTTASRTALGPTQPPIQWVRGVLSLGVKRPGREADNSPPSSVEVKEYVALYLHSPNRLSWPGVHLKKITWTTLHFT
jgi:hypothetical protein